VLQFTQKKFLSNIDWQIEYYLNNFPKHCQRMFISNPGLRAKDFLGSSYFNRMLEKLREAGVQWLHVLGAGWDIQDVMLWCCVGVDSIDSVAWYNNAKSKQEALDTSIEFYQICETMKSI
jgi:hypothetical protein